MRLLSSLSIRKRKSFTLNCALFPSPFIRRCAAVKFDFILSRVHPKTKCQRETELPNSITAENVFLHKFVHFGFYIFINIHNPHRVAISSVSKSLLIRHLDPSSRMKPFGSHRICRYASAGTTADGAFFYGILKVFVRGRCCYYYVIAVLFHYLFDVLCLLLVCLFGRATHFFPFTVLA